MSAKKSSDKKNTTDPYLESGENAELEKKVDKFMSVEADKVSPSSSDNSSSEPSSAPLLPSDKLPDLSKSQAAVQPTAKPEAPPAKPVPDPKEAPLKNTQSELVKPEAPDELRLEDASTNRAVDDIIASESDQLLNSEDQANAEAAETPLKTASKNPIKRFFSAWWHSKLARRLTVLVLLLAIAAAFIVPDSRYFILNTAGVRSATSVKILDETTGQPLKNVNFSIAGKSTKTDSEGMAQLSELKLGEHDLKVNKAAFAEINRPIVIGWGSNPLGDINLKPVGVQYKFTVTDFLSKEPISGAEISSFEASAKSNTKGEAVLTIDQTDQNEIEVKVNYPFYRTENLKLQTEDKTSQEVKLVPGRKHAFISKQAGTLDVYKIDVDGKNQEKVLAGTGREKADDMILSVHPVKSFAALVSARDNFQGGGTIISDLNIINLSDNTVTKIGQSERLQIVDWIGNKLIYIKLTQGSNTDSNDRHKIFSYDIESDQEKELASSNYFNNVMSVKGAVYFSPAAYKVNGSVGLYKINPDGSGKQTIHDKEVWSIFRTSYNKLSVSLGQDWLELNLDNDQLSPLSSPPATQKSRLYIDAQNGNQSLWVDERDGKGALLSYNLKSKEDKVIISQSGLKNPVTWLTDKHVIYRINNNQETADYIFNIEGGNSLKIRDVTDTASIDRWYYY